MEESTKSDHLYVDSSSDSIASNDDWQDLSKSEYARVIFCDRFHNTENGSIGCKFQITDNVHEDPCDVIGLFKVGYESIDQCLVSKMLSETICEEDGKLLRCVFEQYELPSIDNGFYQFLYVTQDKEVCGASMPFEIKSQQGTEKAPNDELITERVEDDFLMVRFFLEQQNTILETQIKSEREIYQKNLEELKNKLSEVTHEKNESIRAMHIELNKMSDMHILKMTAGEQTIEELKKEYEKMLLEERKKVAKLLDEKKSLQLNVTNLSSVVDNQAKMCEAKAMHEQGIARELQDSEFMIKALEDSKKLAMKEVRDVANLLSENNKALERLRQENRQLEDKYHKTVAAHQTHFRENGMQIKKDQDGKVLFFKDFDNALYDHLKDEIGKLKNELIERNCEILSLKVTIKDNDVEGLKKQICSLRSENLALKVKVGNNLKSAQFIKEYEDTTNLIVNTKFNERQREFLIAYEILKRLEIIIYSILPYLPSELQSQVYIAAMNAKEVTDDFLVLPAVKVRDTGPQNLDELKGILNHEMNFSNKCVMMWNYFKLKKFFLALPDTIENKDGSTKDLGILSRRVSSASDANILNYIEQLDHTKECVADKLYDHDRKFIEHLNMKFVERQLKFISEDDNPSIYFETLDVKMDLNQIDRISTIMTNLIADSIKQDDINVKNALLPLECLMSLLNRILKAEYEAIYLHDALIVGQKMLSKVTKSLSDLEIKSTVKEEELQKLQKSVDELNEILVEKNNNVDTKETIKGCVGESHLCDYHNRLIVAKEIYKTQYLEIIKLKKMLRKLNKKKYTRSSTSSSESASVVSEPSTSKKSNDSDTGESLVTAKEIKIMDAVKELEKTQCNNSQGQCSREINIEASVSLPDSCKEYVDAYAQVKNIPIAFSTVQSCTQDSTSYSTTLVFGEKTIQCTSLKSKEDAEEIAANHAAKDILESKEVYMFCKEPNDKKEITTEEKKKTKATGSLERMIESRANGDKKGEIMNIPPENTLEEPILSNQLTISESSTNRISSQLSDAVVKKENDPSNDAAYTIPCSFCNVPITVSNNSLQPMVDHLQMKHHMRLCPVCGQTFNESFPIHFVEMHVESHFKNQ